MFEICCILFTINAVWQQFRLGYIWASSWGNLHNAYGSNEVADQPPWILHSLIGILVVNRLIKWKFHDSTFARNCLCQVSYWRGSFCPMMTVYLVLPVNMVSSVLLPFDFMHDTGTLTELNVFRLDSCIFIEGNKIKASPHHFYLLLDNYS